MIRTIHEKGRKFIAGLLLLTTETIISLSLFAGAVILFFFIAGSVFRFGTAGFDAAAFVFLERFINDRNTSLVALITHLGDYQFLVPANLLLIFYYLVIRRHRWYSIKIPAVACGSLATMLLLKLWFSRPRPLGPLLGPALGYSFPSGHAVSSVTFFGLVIYFVWKKKTLVPSVRALLILLLVLVILLIGVSRVYLRVHYASDVLAGYCVGVIWLFISIHVLDRIEEKSKRKLAPLVEQS